METGDTAIIPYLCPTCKGPTTKKSSACIPCRSAKPELAEDPVFISVKAKEKTMSKNSSEKYIQATWVGGWPSLNQKIEPRLRKEFGINLKQIVAKNPNRTNTHTVLGNTELVLICTENISHPASDSIVNQARKRGVPIIYASKRWSITKQRLAEAGYPPRKVEIPSTSDGVKSDLRKKRKKVPPTDMRQLILMRVLAIEPTLTNPELLEAAKNLIRENHPLFEPEITNGSQAMTAARKSLGIIRGRGPMNHADTMVNHEKYLAVCTRMCLDHLDKDELPRDPKAPRAIGPDVETPATLFPTAPPNSTPTPPPEKPTPDVEAEEIGEKAQEDPTSQDTFIAALELLREEMERREFVKLTLTVEGEVSFEKKVYRPIIESGNLKL